MFCIIMNEIVTISIRVLLLMFKNRLYCVLKLSNVKRKRSHITCCNHKDNKIKIINKI